jgi:hypothetical protein
MPIQKRLSLGGVLFLCVRPQFSIAIENLYVRKGLPRSAPFLPVVLPGFIPLSSEGVR